MNKIELAYLAGIMDADGSFSIAIDTWRQRKYGRNPAYQEVVAISQCDTEALELLQKHFGGNVRPQKSRGKNRRRIYAWQATNRRAIVVVRALLPYLRIKRRQAEILLEVREIKDRGRKANTYLAGPYSRRRKPEVEAELYELARQVRQRNDTRFPLPLAK